MNEEESQLRSEYFSAKKPQPGYFGAEVNCIELTNFYYCLIDLLLTPKTYS